MEHSHREPHFFCCGGCEIIAFYLLEFVGPGEKRLHMFVGGQGGGAGGLQETPPHMLSKIFYKKIHQ